MIERARDLFNSWPLATQCVASNLVALITLGMVTWVSGLIQAETCFALLAGGLLCTLVASILMLRTSRAITYLKEDLIAWPRDDIQSDDRIDLQRSSLDLQRLTLHLRQLLLDIRYSQRALAEKNRLLGTRLDARTHELSTLQELSIGLATKADIPDLIDEALHALERTLDYSCASVWARDERAASSRVVLLGYRVAEHLGADKRTKQLRGMRLSKVNLHTYEQVERAGEALIDNHAKQSLLSWLWTTVVDDARTSELYKNTQSWMAVPMKFRESVVGVMRVDHQSANFFDAEKSRLLTAVASQAALAMRHAKLLEIERDNAVIAERNRIARELHDAVSQTLFAANVVAGTLAKLATVEGPLDRQSVLRQASALEGLNRGALAELRMLMFELRPDALEHVKLPELLQLAIQSLTCRGDMTVEQSLAHEDQLPVNARLQLYRIAQEAISNVLRHSGANHVRITWSAPWHGRVTLCIKDNGYGFDVNERKPGHFGLDNMQSRAEEIGAKLTLTSTPGNGCEVLVEMNRALDDN